MKTFTSKSTNYTYKKYPPLCECLKNNYHLNLKGLICVVCVRMIHTFDESRTLLDPLRDRITRLRTRQLINDTLKVCFDNIHFIKPYRNLEYIFTLDFGKWDGQLSHWCREGKILVVRPLKKTSFICVFPYREGNLYSKILCLFNVCTMYIVHTYVHASSYWNKCTCTYNVNMPVTRGQPLNGIKEHWVDRFFHLL